MAAGRARAARSARAFKVSPIFSRLFLSPISPLFCFVHILSTFIAEIPAYVLAFPLNWDYFPNKSEVTPTSHQEVPL